MRKLSAEFCSNHANSPMPSMIQMKFHLLRLNVWGGAIALTSFLSSAANPSIAQVIPDASLSNASMTQTLGNTTFITGGVQRGHSLFHSFTQFSIPTQQAVQFQHPSEIHSIFSRVTGNSISEINGLLQTQGNTSLFLMNPNGILLGPQARLNIGGSFVATTASSIVLENGFEFRSQQPNDIPPLLTMSVTPGIQYGQPIPGSLIQTQGMLKIGQDLRLQADQLRLQGQIEVGQNLILQAQHLQVRDTPTVSFYAIAGKNMIIQGDQHIDILALQFPKPAFQSGGAIHLLSNGNISADAHFISQADFSILKLAGTPGQFMSLFDPIIRSNGNVIFGDYIGNALKVEAGGNITTGNIIILGPDRFPRSHPQNPGGSSIPSSDPDYLALTTSPALILRAGIAPLPEPIDRLPIEIGIASALKTTFRNTTEPLLPGNITIQGSIATIAWPTEIPLLALVGLTSSDKGGNIELSATGNIVAQSDILSFSNASNGGAIKISSSLGAINLPGNVASLSKVAQGSNVTIAALKDVNVKNVYVAGGDLKISSQKGAINTTSGILNTGVAVTDLSRFVKLSADWAGLLPLLGIDFKIAEVMHGGNVTLNASDSIQVSIINTLGVQSSGNINIHSTQGGILTKGLLNTGVINPRILALVNSDMIAEISANNPNLLSGAGASGDISLEANQAIQIKDTFINLSSGVNGQSGEFQITSNEAISLSNSSIFSEMNGRGGGDFYLTGRSLQLDQSAIISEAGINNQQTSGNIWVNASDVILENRSYLGTQNRSPQRNGDLTINTDRLFLQGESAISTSTDSVAKSGLGGRLTINARDRIWLKGNGQFSGAILSGSLSPADGGEIQIQTPWLRLQDSGIITTATGKDGGQAGNLKIDADLVEIIGSSESGKFGPSVLSVDTFFDLEGVGNAGRLMMNSDRIVLQNGGLISASTFNQGAGGDIIINAQDSIQIHGKLAQNNIRSGIYAQSFGSGNAGSIDLTTQRLEVFGGAKITVDSDTQSIDTVNFIQLANQNLEFVKSLRSRGFKVLPDIEFVEAVRSGDAGDIKITAKSIVLNQGSLSAITSSGEGGNINLQVNQDPSRINSPFLLLKNQSEISATAKGTGNGGNISITAPFILSFPQENSDIKANAFEGRGGRVNINAKAILWLEPRSRNDLRRLLKTNNPLELDPVHLPTNDITAISQSSPQLSGVVNIDTLGLDPSRGLIALPQEMTLPERDRRCESVPIGKAGKFVRSGRGGLALGSGYGGNLTDIHVDLATPMNSQNSTLESTSSLEAYRSSQIPIPIEAQGLIKTSTGEVRLISESTDAISVPNGFSSCAAIE
jgi:filamentous hemagglutinin family protein